MKRLSMIMMCLLAMMAAGTSLKAQEVTIPLMPGWTWISYPNTDTVDFVTALGSFTPAIGDIIESQYAYSEYSEGEWFGGVQQFYPGRGFLYYSNRTMPVYLTFNAQQPASQVVVTTTEPADITTTSAVVGGTVTIGEGNHVFARGICWGMEQMPNIDGNHISVDAVEGDFSVTLIGLISSTTYYVRAYAVSDQGLIYGEEVSFTTLQSNAPIGAIDGLFSVSSTQKVYFSQGNLQYIGSVSTPYWKFAENQWDYLGTTTGQNSANHNIDRDLFGWGTSGYNHGAICYQPWSTSENNVDYNPYGNSYTDLYEQTGQADWGYNAISNGGNQENQWRTLNYFEWNYLLYTRSTLSGIRFAKAQVNNVNGVIILPNNWNEDVYHLNNTNQSSANYNSNIITASVWSSMESSGAVFLPASGTRSGTSVGNVGSEGMYWTSSRTSENGAFGLLIEDGFFAIGYTFRSSGYSVRLVRNLPAALPEVGTFEPTSITSTTAIVGGIISDNGGAEITECGICWDIEQNPTIESNHVSVESVTIGEFTIELTDLNPNTTYYFRSYASNSVGTGYGEVMSFTTNDAPVGTINGLFTVSNSGTKVHFARGNLQYIGSAATPYWKFADHQWDYLGTSTGQDSDSENVDRDLFGWGTSGYDHGAICYQPWGINSADTAYYAYGNYTFNLFDQTGQADWGYNVISNGGNQENQWRTLTENEWKCLFQTRNTESGLRFAKAQVNEVYGVILLPDNWNPSTYALNNPNGGNYDSNTISAADWTNILEPAGAVFLPAGGRRYGTTVSGVGNYGYYWSSSNWSGSNNNNIAAYLSFSTQTNLSTNPTGGTNRRMGMCVRLVYMTLPAVDTVCPIYLGNKSAIFSGTISDYGGNDILACGVCCSTEQNPTTDDIVALAQTVTNGGFRTSLFNLIPNTTYYVRAFATNRMGTAYGEEMSFTTLEEAPQIMNGALPGVFSVSATQLIRFSQGNLQYIGSSSAPYWKFAENQWDYLGNNGQGSTSQNVDRDLFGWGTSGFNHGAIAYQPWKTSTVSSQYYAYGQWNYNLNDQTGQADWGYNAISNGGNTTGIWRTMTLNEWKYLFNTRVTANGIRFAKAQVNDVNGVVLLPDDWSADVYDLNDTNQNNANFDSNVISSSEWSVLEAAGAVFLPVTGQRNGTYLSWLSQKGYYWSTSYYDGYEEYAAFVEFDNSSLTPNIVTSRYMGHSVRLIRPVEN
jgi:hypothetical protein